MTPTTDYYTALRETTLAVQGMSEGDTLGLITNVSFTEPAPGWTVHRVGFRKWCAHHTETEAVQPMLYASRKDANAASFLQEQTRQVFELMNRRATAEAQAQGGYL